MKSPYFLLIYVLGTVTACTFFLWCGGIVGSKAYSSEGVLPLRKIADVLLTGGTTRFDYQSYDPQTRLLFIAHLGDSVVTVFDTQSQKVIKDIPDIGSVHGVLAVPELDRVYASATKTNEVVAIDEKTLKIMARIPGGTYPDGMAFAPSVNKLYVSDETGSTETVIDVSSNTRVATIALGGEVGNTQHDSATKHIFVNVQGRGDLAEIDPASDKVSARYPLSGAKGNHGLLIDSLNRLAFIACENNDKLLVMDLTTKRIVLISSVGREPDVLAYDPDLRLLYIAGERGVVSLFRVWGRSVQKLGDGFLGPNAHTVAIDKQTHRAYFPLKDVGGAPLLRIMEPEGTSGR
jgi:DNA-binding beta-propeller fold protein YncE